MRCANCHDEVTEFANSEDCLGRCCVNLPLSWSTPGHHRGFETGPADGEARPHTPQPLEVDESGWQCPHCGCSEDVCIERTEVYVGRLGAGRITDRMADSDGQAWWESDDTNYDEESSASLSCDGCGADVSRSFDRE